ncbi:hypothetical protein MNBD_ALPHA05-480 [hydrothermal vent metagenome]|uniref:Uncharacterized protein n=1 Tax=hydrothermal vent metagenome TaxID=652676 RepID=A0A3B0SM10_9ZZZZ
MMVKLFKSIAVLSACLAALLSPLHAKGAKPLFRDDSILKIRIEAPFSKIKASSARSTDPYPAILYLDGEAPERHVIELSARGNSRRDKNTCTFAPLRVAFSEKPVDSSLFDGQKRLKLVTHCKSSKSFQQYYLLEYTAYKLFNVITPISLKVRLAEIDYINSKNGKTIITRYGFFIEDADDTAKRNKLKELDVADARLSQLDTQAAARYALFQYMIGNLDWAMHDAVAGKDCCHNTKLLGPTKDASSGIIPLPYDFDYSGLVDTPYAVPPLRIPIRSVTTRRYRGYCVHNDAVRETANRFNQNRDALYQAIAQTPALNENKRATAMQYLDRFFDVITDPVKMEKRLFSNCRGKPAQDLAPADGR